MAESQPEELGRRCSVNLSYDDIFLYCKFNGFGCSSNDFEIIWDAVYINCFQFKPIIDRLELGYWTGLKAGIFISDNINVSSTKHSAHSARSTRGLTIRLFQPGNLSSPFEQKYDIPPGQSMDLEIRQNVLKKTGALLFKL